MPGLRWVIERTAGPVLELGAGYFSTPYLHTLKNARGMVVSYEYDPAWAREVERIYGAVNHWVVTDFDLIPLRAWGVVLIDCEGWNRQRFFNELAPRTMTFVLHDTQDPWIDEVTIPRDFIFRHDFGDSPRTTLVSRALDVTKFPE